MKEPDLARIRKAFDYIQIPLGSYVISMAASGRDEVTHNLLSTLGELANYPNIKAGDDGKNQFVIDKIKKIYEAFNNSDVESNDAIKKFNTLKGFLDITYELMDGINDGKIPIDNPTAKLKLFKKLANQFAEKNHLDKKYINAEKIAIANGKTILDYEIHENFYLDPPVKDEANLHEEDKFSSRIEGIKNTFGLLSDCYSNESENFEVIPLSYSKLWFKVGLSTLSFTRHSRALYNIIHLLYSYGLNDELNGLISIEKKRQLKQESDEEFAKKLIKKLHEIFLNLKKSDDERIKNISKKLREMTFRNVHLRDRDDLFSDLLGPLKEYINEISRDLYGKSFIRENNIKKYINIKKLNEDEEKRKKISSSEVISVSQSPNQEKQKRRNTKKKIKTFQFWFSIIVAISEACASAVFGATVAGLVFPPAAPFVAIAIFIGMLTASAFGSNWSLFAWASGKGLEEFLFNPTKDEKGKEISGVKKKLLVPAIILSILTASTYGFLSYYTATLSVASIIKILVVLGVAGGISAIPGGVIIVVAAVIGICLFAGLTFLYYKTYSNVIKNDQLHKVKKWLADKFYMKDLWRKLNSWESWKHVGKCILYALPVLLALTLSVIVTVSTFGLLTHQTIWALEKSFSLYDSAARGVGLTLGVITKIGDYIFDTEMITKHIISVVEGCKSAFLTGWWFFSNPVTPTKKAVTIFLDDPAYVYAKTLSFGLWGFTKLVTLANAFGYGSGGAMPSSLHALGTVTGISDTTALLPVDLGANIYRSVAVNGPPMDKIVDPSLPSINTALEQRSFFSRAKTFLDFIVEDYSLPENQRTPGNIAWHVVKCTPKAIIHSTVAIILTTLALPIAMVWVPAKLIQIAWRACSGGGNSQENVPCLPAPKNDTSTQVNLSHSKNSSILFSKNAKKKCAQESISVKHISSKSDSKITIYPH